MRLRSISSFLSVIVLVVSFFMLLPLLWAISEESASIPFFAIPIGVGLAVSAVFFLLGRGAAPEDLGTRETFAAVTFAWVAASLLGCIPYIISGAIPNFTNAYFEAMSGFTTTGATILDGVERLPEAVLLWRSQTQWLGGMGIVVLIIAILPALGVSVNQLFKAEMPGFRVDKLHPRMQDTAILLWETYMAVTVVGLLLLLAARMSFLDALCHVFGAVSTGGFSTRSAGMAYLASPLVEWITVALMFFCGVNFNLLLMAIKKGSPAPYRDAEFRFYVKLIAAASLTIFLFLKKNNIFQGLHEPLRHAIFQVVSIVTTTGLATTDYGLWPVACQLLLLFLMFVGGCSCSTAGGIKCSRILIVLKHIHAEGRRFLHPNAVIAVRMDRRAVDNATVASASVFITLYLCVFMLSALIVAATGESVVTALSGVATTLSNVGPGFGAIGPSDTFLTQHAASKWTYIFCMLCGRLELYTVLVLFSRDAWRR